LALARGELVDDFLGRPDRVLTASADGILEALNHPMARAEDLKCTTMSDRVQRAAFKLTDRKSTKNSLSN
jgi:hypothetical protein